MLYNYNRSQTATQKEDTMSNLLRTFADEKVWGPRAKLEGQHEKFFWSLDGDCAALLDELHDDGIDFELRRDHGGWTVSWEI